MSFGLLAALVLFYPASWVADALTRASQQRVLLADAQGSLWSGSAVVVLTGGEGSREAFALPGRLTWRLRPGWQDARPALVARITHDGLLRQPLRAAAMQGSDGLIVGLDTLDWHGPAGVLRGLGTPWNTLAFEGDLKLTAQGLQLLQTPNGWRLGGALAMQAEKVTSRISTVRPLGSYRMELDGQQGGTQIRLSTLVGPLELKGGGAFIAGQLRFQGQARADADRRQALGNVLNLIGNRDGPVALRILN